MWRAFAAALESPDHGLGDEPTKAAQRVLAGTHPDVTVLATNKVTIGIDEVRDIITTSEQMPSTAPWRIIIIEDVDRMLERTTNVLLKEIEEPSGHTIWLLCAPSAQDVLPTIRSRTRIVNLAVPSTQAVAAFLKQNGGFEPKIAARAARLAEGHIGIANLYAKNEQVMSDRDELIVGVLGLRRASDAVLLAGNLIDSAKAQAEAEVKVKAAEAEADFRRVNGLGAKDRIPPKLRGAYNAIAKKDELKRQTTRLTRDVLDRALNSIASVYRDVAVLQNNAEDSVGLINLENRSSITDLSVRLTRGERCGDWKISPSHVAVWPATAIPYWSSKPSSAPSLPVRASVVGAYCFPACGFLQRVGKWLFGCMILACYCAITVSKIAKSDSALVVGGFAHDQLRCK